MKISLRYPKTTLIFFQHIRWNGSTREQVRNHTRILFEVFFFFYRWCVKVGVKSRYRKQDNVKRVFKKGALPVTVQCANGGLWWRRETARGELSEPLCKGGKGPEGVERWAESLCTCSSSYPLTSHHLSLRIQPQETDCPRLYRQKTQPLSHWDTHREPMQYCTWQRGRLLMLQFIIS